MSVLKGVFRQHPDHPYVALRRQLLDSGALYEALFAPVPAAAGAPEATAATVADQLRAWGVGAVQLDRPMTNPEFRAFGAVLGEPQPERSPDVQPLVEEEVILNLVTSSPASSDPARQPFGANSLSLHSESSGAPPPAQPRYIVLMCLSPGVDDCASQTLLVSMADVHDALPESVRDLLTRVRYDLPGDGPTVLRRVDERPVFSFRDFLDTPLNWTLDAANSDVPTGRNAVDHALTELYTAMYSQRAHGFRWRAGLLVVIDNTWHFHGRAAGPAPLPGQERHLRRMRIAERGADR
ncbi:TauD/TfdA family dioxygenase [Streptomyces rochei]|uniref:TauD/TfdA family dioxygenase n=1 Tax=Streptomyces rochei TaxID=1928 RepID=UPI0036900969